MTAILHCWPALFLGFLFGAGFGTFIIACLLSPERDEDVHE